MFLKIKSLIDLVLKVVFISALTFHMEGSVSVELLNNASFFKQNQNNYYYCNHEVKESDQETIQAENENTPSRN